MKRATANDLPALHAFFAENAPYCMFPAANLIKYGLEGDHDYAPTIWFAQTNGTITDTLTVCRNGTVMPFLPSQDWQSAALCLQNIDLLGFNGTTTSVHPLMEHLNLTYRATLDAIEPHFTLDLADLIIPDGQTQLYPLSHADKDQMIDWRSDYIQAVLATPQAQARKIAATEIETYIANDSHCVLMRDDEPVCTTGFNATLPHIVQIGGVYTPPDLRGHGYARRAVALHLAQIRKTGTTMATLCAASESAARSYQAIGFRRIGTWNICMFDEKIRYHG